MKNIFECLSDRFEEQELGILHRLLQLSMALNNINLFCTGEDIDNERRELVADLIPILESFFQYPVNIQVEAYNMDLPAVQIPADSRPMNILQELMNHRRIYVSIYEYGVIILTLWFRVLMKMNIYD